MFIPRRRLILVSVVLPIALVFGIGLVGHLSHHKAEPTWVELGYAPAVTYVDDYASGVNLSAESAILIENQTGTILFAKNEHVRRPPASTTKVLTALLVLEEGRLDDVVTVSRNAAWTGGSTARLSVGQKLTVQELLYGLLLRSGNDASVALAEYMAGSVAEFAKQMNLRSAELGAENSRWQNPHGMDRPGHFSTAFDLAMISRVALLYPKFEEIVGTQSFDSSSGNWNNTNRLLWSYEGAEGVKTGTTSGAGHCLVAAASRDGRQLISVVLGSRDRWTDSTRLLNYGFGSFHLLPIAQKGQVMAELTLENGMAPKVNALAARGFSQVVRDRDVENVKVKLALDTLSAPVTKGHQIGQLVAYLGDQELGSVPLIAAQSVPRRTPIRVFLRWLGNLVKGD